MTSRCNGNSAQYAPAMSTQKKSWPTKQVLGNDMQPHTKELEKGAQQKQELEKHRQQIQEKKIDRKSLKEKRQHQHATGNSAK